MKKLVSIVLALALVLLTVGAAVAADPTTYSITIKKGLKGHTYTAYQVLSGDYVAATAASTDPETGDPIPAVPESLTNIQWGANVSTTFIDSTYVGGKTAAAFAKTLTNEASAKALAAELAKSGMLTGDGTAVTLNANGDAEISGLADGYYVVMDTVSDPDLTNEENDVFSSYIVYLLGDIEVNNKSSVPELDKDIIGGTTPEATTANIGDTVTFGLTGTLPSNYDDYTTYNYIFHDTMSIGLDYQDDVKVYIGTDNTGTDITSMFTTTASTPSDGTASTTITVSCANLKTNTNIVKTSKIYVEYTAKVTKEAEIGKPGMKNEAYLEFSNNPYDDGTGKTPKDYVVVFTFELDTLKVDASNTQLKLEGAEFELQTSDGSKAAYVDANSKLVGWFASTDTIPTGATKVLTSNANGEFKVIGLKEGSYKLVETKAPDGYNILTDAIPVVINATVTGDETSDPDLTALSIDVGTLPRANGDLDTGIVDATVGNNSGTTLPSTGGIGTTIFYILGGLLVVGAAVILVARRKASN